METRTYRNPVLTGFFPDPSWVRVDDDYYMVNSTFQYFPGVVISHSRDLVHWRQIGYALDDPGRLDLTGYLNSMGVWAPDISMCEGVFYIFYSLVHRHPETGKISVKNCMVSSRRPEGPYSEPAIINTEGIDPSHFVDDDGARYMVFNPGVKIVRLAADSSRAVDNPISLWDGTGRGYPEGPHIYKKDGYYYLLLAEGGTGWEHCITCARSRNLTGPYESSPHGPIIGQTDRSHPIQKAGHGKLVQTQNGEWWICYLCGRTNDGEFCTLGRESCIDPVEWTEDGWPLANGGTGPSAQQYAPDLPHHTAGPLLSDDFRGPALGVQWLQVRCPTPDAIAFDEGDEGIRLLPDGADLDSLLPRTMILQREKAHRAEMITALQFSPNADGQRAGLVSYYDSTCFVRLGLVRRDGGNRLEVEEVRNGKRNLLGECAAPDGLLYLRQVVERQVRRFSFRSDSAGTWKEIGSIDNAHFLSDEGTQEWSFTGTMTGIYATGPAGEPPAWARFRFFEHIPLV